MTMKNDVIFAAAGNGKTYNICKEAIGLSSGTKEYILLVTYTNQGVRSLGKEYREQNFGVIDKNVTIMTWYSFLLSEFIKPYQCCLSLRTKNIKKSLRLVFLKIILSRLHFIKTRQLLVTIIAIIINTL